MSNDAGEAYGTLGVLETLVSLFINTSLGSIPEARQTTKDANDAYCFCLVGYF